MTPAEQSVDQRGADQAATQHRHAPARTVLRRALGSGALASVLCTAVVSAFSRRHGGSAAAGTNASSQWFWYPRARHVDRPSLRYTLVGYAVHHASSVFWACGYEALAPRTATPAGRAVRAAVIAALAYTVDYHVVPRRLSPGFEHRIRPPGMVAAYGLFAVGLFLAAGGTGRRATQPGRPRGRALATPGASARPTHPARPPDPAARPPDR